MHIIDIFQFPFYFFFHLLRGKSNADTLEKSEDAMNNEIIQLQKQLKQASMFQLKLQQKSSALERYKTEMNQYIACVEKLEGSLLEKSGK